MGLHTIRMPDIGEGIAEVELVAWRVQPGDEVQPDQVLADVMTDKATVEIPSPVAGKVHTLGGEPGQLMAVGAELIRLEVEGAGNVREDTAVHARAPQAAPARAPQAELLGSDPDSGQGPSGARRATTDSGSDPNSGSTPTRLVAHAPPPQPSPGRGGSNTNTSTPAKPLASPAVRNRALELGIELRFVHGSGPAGRITHQDLDVYLAARGRPTPTGATRRAERHDEQQIPLVGLRRRIAQKMQEAKRRIPHFSYVEEVDVTALEGLRRQLNDRHGETRGKLTVLPLIARAVIVALERFPQMNAVFDDEGGVVTRHGAVHLGVAAQTDAGLMVPVLRHAEALDVWDVAKGIARLAEAARNGKIAREALSGSTITITSLGPLGGIVTTPVINHPEVAIVGVNRIVERPVWQGGAVVPRLLMNLSSSFDHRVVDGMDAARFIQDIKATLESPALLFVD
jgi:2-oxoisovalerate dehydrogenase E2 component (dihydrolipoyl transacylase)